MAPPHLAFPILTHHSQTLSKAIMLIIPTARAPQVDSEAAAMSNAAGEVIAFDSTAVNQRKSSRSHHDIHY
jgi:hypothetical protein